MNNLKTSPSPAFRSSRLARLALAAILLGGAAVGAMAQAYKVVGPDGKVTYTDKPPTQQDIRVNNGSASPSTGGNLPYETRQAMSKYPVTLYSTRDCAGCDTARQALRQRGVPFNEYSVLLDADFAALQARFGNASFPLITIGSQSMKGYSSNDLQGYLDAAGYPAQAHLSGYSWPPAVPLAPRTVAPVTAAAPAAAPSTPASLLPPPSNNGIQF